jgi:hypothetical protein
MGVLVSLWKACLIQCAGSTVLTYRLTKYMLSFISISVASMPTLVAIPNGTCRLANEIRARSCQYLGGKQIWLIGYA